jgi:D-xylonolactonase
MYVTTAGGNAKATDGEGAGALFRLRLGIRGLPEYRSKIKV